MSAENNEQPLINKSQRTGDINISGNEDPLVNFVNTTQGTTSINQSRTIIYNYYYKEQTVSLAPEDHHNEPLICPYQGLYHFSPEDAEYFFGRTVFIEELFKATETQNFIPILGASGSGKSSVVLAGLVPKLVKIGHWKFTHFRPGKDPFNALAQALVPLYAPNLNQTELIAQTRQLTTYFQNQTILLSDVFTQIQHHHPQDRILLIADQFEELYTLCNDEQTRRQFLDYLLNAFPPSSQVSNSSTILVTTMRADFLGNVLSYPPLADILRTGDIKIRSMNSEELTEVIEKPAQKLGVSFEGGLVERILDDVDKEPGNLPLLEFALTELWKKRNSQQLTHKAYEEIGQVSGALTRYADEQYHKLNEQQQQQVRRIFVQLVRPGEGTGDTRRVATKAELNDRNWTLVKQLADARLVVTGRTMITPENSQQPSNIQAQETVEVVHEALIKNWGQLQHWMNTDREFRAWQERLRTAITQWQEMNRDPGLLLRGAALVLAGERLKDRHQELSDAEQEFIRLSQEIQYQEEKQKQRQRQQFIGGLLAFSLSISLLGVWSEVQRRKAVISEQKIKISALETLLVAGKESLDLRLQGLKLHQEVKGTPAEIPATDLLQKIANRSGEQEINRLQGHENPVNGVAFSPKGDMIASASYDKTVKLWKLDGTLLKTLPGHEDGVIGVAFSPKGDVIASASYDKTVKLWKLDGTLLKTLPGHEDGVIGVAFSPKGDVIASASYDKTVKLWKLDGTLLKTLPGHKEGVAGVAFSPKGDVIASASWDKTVKLWKLDGTLLKTLPGHEEGVAGVAFSPKGDVIASASWDKTVKLWKLDGTLLKTLPGHEEGVAGVAFSPKGDVIASASLDKTVKLWKLDGTLLKTLPGHKEGVAGVAFSPKGDVIASASWDKTVKLWKLDGTLLKTLPGHENGVIGVAFSPKGDVIASASLDKTVKLWKLDGTLLKTLPGHEDGVIGVAFSPKGDVIASASGDKTVKLWKLDGTLLKTLPGHEDWVNSVAFSPKGDVIASASLDKTVKLWKLDGTLLKTLPGHEGWVYGVAFSPKGDMLASASGDKTVKLWKLDGTLLKTLPGHENGVIGVAFSPKGDVIASASLDKTVKLWKLDGTLLKTLPGHEDGVIGVAFSPKGDVIASASGDKTVKLWKLDGTLLKTLPGHEDGVIGVAFSPKGDVIASASGDKTVKLWNLNPEQLLIQACQWVNGYLKNNPIPSDDERRLCGVEASATARFLQGEQQAVKGNIKEAVSKFQQAVKLDSNFSLKLASASLVKQGKQLAINRQIDPAISAYHQAQNLDADLKIDAWSWNTLCWDGSLNSKAKEVIFACNKAVELDPKNGLILDSRGLARALTGDFKGAIEDFEIFVKSAGNAEKKKQRKGWIEALKQGKNPFTPEELEKLR